MFVSANYHTSPCVYDNMVINKMQNLRIVIASVVIVALTLTVVGLASAQGAANQTYAGTNPNTALNNSFWGWMGNCFGFRNSQPNANQYVAPQAPTNSSVPAPYIGNYEYGYGFGPCWARR
jgi:hypothetical protein